jgi:PRTRC genetic system protein E
MFKELVPILRDRAVLLTVTLVDADQIRVNIVPKKTKDGDNDALTIPLSVTGTAEELDSELPSTIIGFVGSHLQMKNTLEKAKAEMDAASKAAQAEARAKSKPTTKQIPPKTDVSQPAIAAKPIEPAKPEPPKIASLFDEPAIASAPTVAPAKPMEDTNSYAQFAEVDDDDDDDEPEEYEDLDEVA